MHEIRLPDALALSLAAGHPWVYRDHVPREKLPSGTWVKVHAASFSAYGLWDAESQIAVRLYSTERVPDASWISDRVREAYELREQVRAGGVNGYRLIYGEADQLAGIVVDVYDTVAIVVAYSESVRPLVKDVALAVSKLPGIRSVALRSRSEEGVSLDVLFGAKVPERLVISEGRRRLEVELFSGQKTGLFFDHRDNRDYVGTQAEGATVLNLFSYTGGFSVAAAMGGSVAVTSVDIAEPAVRASERNFALNGLATPHEAIAQDVFAFLEKAVNTRKVYDIVVCDPPSFAKNREQLKGAEKAYSKLLTLAFRVTKPGGLLCAASCTSQVGPVLFRKLLADATRKARVRFQVTRDIGHAPDHPVLVGHEEGRYLKFVAGRVMPRV